MTPQRSYVRLTVYMSKNLEEGHRWLAQAQRGGMEDAEGAAYEYYTHEVANECLKYATSLLKNVERLLTK